MARYLVAADADQIQHLLFRSSHLREVIGGSMLLTKFCKETTSKIVSAVEGNSDNDVIINDAGNFRLAFDAPERAAIFLEQLAEHYRMETGGTLTIAGPLEYEAHQFEGKNRALQLILQEAKLSRPGAEVEPQLPVSAFCASCGTELATRYATPTPELSSEFRDEETYQCEYCSYRGEERKNDAPDFYKRFLAAIHAQHQNALIKNLVPDPKEHADRIASLDANQYVGYILADVNGMGKRFNKCDSETKLGELSKKLTAALWTSLAAPVSNLLERLDERKKLKKLEGRLPIMPLILGGDDLLALAPARYALDSARRIGEKFEEEMKIEKAKLGLAVIICQQHYPYTLAYARGKELLNDAKKLGKAEKIDLSAVNFEMILGNELKNSEEQPRNYLTTLKPYWIAPASTALSEGAKRAGLHLNVLLDQRRELKDLPMKRLHEVRRRFDEVRAERNSQWLKQWQRDFKKLLQRIGSEKLNKAMIALGTDLEVIFRTVQRPNQKDPYSAHGLPDLIEVWDYAYKLDEPEEKYKPEAR